MFYNEIDLLLVRLRYMWDSVDKFIIVESAEGFTRKSKPLYFQENRNLFKEFEYKIIYCSISAYESNNPWENEFYSRNYFHNVLDEKASDEDIVILSDVDEIINLKPIFDHYIIDRPHFVKMYCFYGFLNIRSSEEIDISMIAPYGAVKNEHWGHRYNMRDRLANKVFIDNRDIFTGGHYTYQYGNSVDKYINKLNNFAHQELNTSYYKNPNRILFCLKYKYDLFNRDLKMHKIDMSNLFDANFLFFLQNNDQLKGLIYHNPIFLDELKKFFTPFFYDRLIKVYRKRFGKMFPFLVKIKKFLFK
jgi:beta-1,4-mannosyl-glycoprotein beta-1,4-N-acetylglucosaminyltransferase